MNPNHHDTTHRWFGRAGTILAIVGFLLLPLVARADTVYFCNASVSQGGNGSATSPWACADDAQLEAVLNTVCTNGGGTLYRSLSESFVTYNVEAVANAGCTVASQITPGQPPTSGGDSLSSTLLLAVGLLGAAALIIGLVLRLRPTRS
jgi:hypothetical protein